MRAKEFVLQNILESILDEFKASPSSLASLAANIDARAGMEFEMVVPGFTDSDDDGDMEIDFGPDRRPYDIIDIIEFFAEEGINDRRSLDKVRDKLTEDFFDYADEAFYSNWHLDARDEIAEYIRDNDLWTEEDGDFDEFVDDALKNQGSIYDNALEHYRDNKFDYPAEKDFLWDKGYQRMSDVYNDFNDIIDWPYITRKESSVDIESVVDEFEEVIGRKVNWSTRYHGGKREPGAYVIEPDSSIHGDDGDAGLEFVSPPLPLQELFSDLDKVVQYARDAKFYTNDSTGLHINVSIQNVVHSDLDYVKLVLLLGDEYVLSQFGRMGNSYAQSSLNIVRKQVATNPGTVQELLGQMKGKLRDLASKLIHSGITNKYVSVNVKDGYVEFRSPGGDWLGSNFDLIKSTILRFVVALDAAYSPDKYRQEYLKKLYALLVPKEQQDLLGQAFAKFQAGVLTKNEFKQLISSSQAQRVVRQKPGTEVEWKVVAKTSENGSEIVNIVASSEKDAITKAIAANPSWRNIPVGKMTATPRQVPAMKGSA